MEGEAVLVSACGRGPHDQSKDAAIYGSSNGRERPLEPDLVIDVILEACVTLGDGSLTGQAANG